MVVFPLASPELNLASLNLNSAWNEYNDCGAVGCIYHLIGRRAARYSHDYTEVVLMRGVLPPEHQSVQHSEN